MIRRRLTSGRNQNYVAFWAGQTGSGKTTSATAFATQIDPNFAAENVVWTMRDFLEIMDRGEFSNGKKLVPGSVVLFDEFAAEVGSRDWNTILNKLCIKVLQTFRYLNICVIFTGPSLSLADSKTKILLHGYFQTDPDIIYHYYLVKVRVYKVVHNSMKNKTYMMHYHAIVDGERVKIPNMLVGMPSPQLIDEIEKRSKQRKKDIMSESGSKLETHLMDISGVQSTDKRFDPKAIGDSIIEDPDKSKYGTKRDPSSLSATKIAAIFEISDHFARIVKAYVDHKVKSIAREATPQ